MGRRAASVSYRYRPDLHAVLQLDLDTNEIISGLPGRTAIIYFIGKSNACCCCINIHFIDKYCVSGDGGERLSHVYGVFLDSNHPALLAASQNMPLHQ